MFLILSRKEIYKKKKKKKKNEKKNEMFCDFCYLPSNCSGIKMNIYISN